MLRKTSLWQNSRQPRKQRNRDNLKKLFRLYGGEVCVSNCRCIAIIFMLCKHINIITHVNLHDIVLHCVSGKTSPILFL